ncbi:MAG: zinc-dependent alcohol dehydrogenase family protein [Atribacterota bacterium]|nr:zinc-dependent alcohol dehydrogenase family protein [Atribacterota bacterium]
MRAMVLSQIEDLQENRSPLKLVEMPLPPLGEQDILIQVSVCGVCRTELDEIEGRTPPSFFPVILGHQIVGEVVETGQSVSRFRKGDRVGVAWIYSSCGRCHFCQKGQENLCPEFKGTGRDAHGGYAEYAVVEESFAYPLPAAFSDEEAAPLLCAGAVGYRALKLGKIENGENIGVAGFGASGHLVMKVARHLYPASKIFVFSRSPREQSLAWELGASWVGNFDDEPSEKLHCVIDTTPVWRPVVTVLRKLAPGGRLIINAIRKEESDKEYLLRLNYSEHLWMEKEIKSVANVTRQDVVEFLELAARIPIRPEIEVFKLEEANHALLELKEGKIRGAKVLRIKEA